MATKRDFANAFESEVITLFVGPELRKFTAHRAYLIKVPFFAACLEKDFKEGGEGVIKLPEDDSQAVKKVLEYLYGNKFEHPHPLPIESSSAQTDEEVSNCWASLARCYIAADKYCLEDLQNKIMDFVKGAARHTVARASGIQEFSKAGLRGCSMRMFLLQEMAYEQLLANEDEESFIEIGEEQSKLLTGAGYDAEDLLLACLNLNKAAHLISPSQTNNCDLHVHKESKKCS